MLAAPNLLHVQPGAVVPLPGWKGFPCPSREPWDLPRCWRQPRRAGRERWGGLRLSRDPVRGEGPALLRRDRGARNPQACCAAEGNQSTGLKDRLENINSSLLIVCLKTPINVYTYVPGRHVYPQLMALSGSWNGLCVTTSANSQPSLIYSFPAQTPSDLFKSHPNYSLPLTLQCK